MSHQSNTSTLGSTIEEGDFGTILLEVVCVEHGCCIGVGMHTLAIAGLVCNDGYTIAVHTNSVTVNNLQSRLVGLSKGPTVVSMGAQRFVMSH
jgi:hypothetical protein